MFATGIGRVKVLGQPVGGQGGFFRAEGRAQHTLGFPRNQPLLPADHYRFINSQPGEQSFRCVIGGAEQVECSRFFPKPGGGVGIPHKGDIHSGQRLCGSRQDFLRQIRGTGAHKGFMVVLLT